MNESFMKQVSQLETFCGALTCALPALRLAGETLKGPDLRIRVEEIGAEYGLAELL